MISGGPRRAAIDTNAVYTTRAGVARYVRGLLGGLRRVAPPSDWAFEESAWAVENFDFRQPRRAWCTFQREILWAGWLAPRALRRSRPGLYHSTGAPLLDPPRSIRHVVTVHDIGFLHHPERFRPWHRRAVLRALERTRRANLVICISKFTADELVKWAGFDPSRLRVVHNGCTFQSAALSPETAGGDRRPAGDDHPPTPEGGDVPALPAEFLLFVGSLEPGKNLGLLRQTYELALRERLALPDLVIVGARFAGLASEGPPPKGWHYLGHIPDSDLVRLYRGALALVFPSKYEGFGLPIAEAMNLECPVICSPVSSLPEVAGDAALLAELEPRAYLGAIQRLLGERGLREDLIARGLRQGRQFNWDRCAAETLQVYREVLES